MNMNKYKQQLLTTAIVNAGFSGLQSSVLSIIFGCRWIMHRGQNPH